MGIDKEYITMKHKWNKDLTNYKYKQGTCANCGGTTNYKEDYKGTFARQKKYCYDCEWEVHLSFDEWMSPIDLIEYKNALEFLISKEIIEYISEQAEEGDDYIMDYVSLLESYVSYEAVEIALVHRYFEYVKTFKEQTDARKGTK